MSITVAELIALPHLGLEVVAGRAGLEREVGWAHVCELEDPRPWLEGGELVMTTGMAVPREPGRQAAYLERLAACGVAGLAISKDLCAPPLTRSFLRCAETLGFPVVAVSIEVPFVAIARIVVMANSDASSRQLVRQIAVFDALRDSTALSDLPALFRRLEHVSGFELYLCSPAGLPLPGVPGIPDDRRDLLDRPGDAPDGR
jgi:PucR family transcriptional regulator, purine catabolism regulatory protein